MKARVDENAKNPSGASIRTCPQAEVSATVSPIVKNGVGLLMKVNEPDRVFTIFL